MKAIKFLLVFLLIFSAGKLFAQAGYETQWKKVDELINKKNLPKSALAEVKKIYAQAKKERNDAQLVKSLVYMIGLQEDTREENDVQSIKDVEKEIATAKEPALSILKSLQANLYWNYFRSHRYDLYDRTNTVNFVKTDITTWTATDLHKKISELFLASLKNDQLLKNARLEPFDAIIIKGNLRNLRPTLYDLLAHDALEYFKNDERDIEKPSYAFEIDQPEAFAPALQFIKQKFTTRDSLSLQHKALLIYQDLIAFHLNDAKPDALIDLDIERISFVHDKATMENKDELYKAALENVIAKFPSNPYAAQASYLLASYYNDLASEYKPFEDTSHRYDKVKAKAILEKVVRDSALKTPGWVNSYNLLKQITEESFSFDLEKVNLPDRPFRGLVNYSNIANLNFRLIKATDAIKEGRYNEEDKFWQALIKAIPLRSWTQLLPATNDYQQHSVEIKIDGLPVGEYILLASSNGEFDKKGMLAQRLFYISNISFINYQEEFFVLHRETGQPLSNAGVQVWENRYNNKTHEYVKTKIDLYKTDAKGYFKLKSKDQYGFNYYFEVSYGNDHLFLNEPLYGSFPEYYEETTEKLSKEEYEKSRTHTYLFTDRSIYRPGQTIYFKGISVTKTKEDGNKIRAGFKTKIYLQNANGQAVDSMIVTTNEYGSFSGKFLLPANGLNGAFSLQMEDNKGYQTFNVEEYKRPKFYVEFDKVKQSYKVNDTIQLTGSAKAYAGNNIDDAKVVYRVVRRPRFLYDWMRWWQPPTQSMEIAHGEINTDADGKFSISFPAIPDRSIDRKTDPVFDYQVYVDVTDINGETRSNETLITAGYKSLLIKTSVDERIPVDSFKTISVRTENMNGEFQSSYVTVSIYKLIPEQRLIRNRLWERPDQFIMSKAEFISFFPHDEYATETDFKTWPREKMLYSITDTTRENGEWMIKKKPEAGFYAIEFLTKDKEGQEVKDIKYVELFDPNAKQLQHPEYLWTKGSTKPIEPGEKTSVQIGSSSDVFLIQRKDQPSSDPEVSYASDQINNEKKAFEYSATEADRGGYGINFFFVRDNRLYSFNDIISVPWTNKDLHIEYTTFRDKTLPGTEEKWKVKITGYKNEKLAGEMLTSMYDASLDQFYFHQWDKPYLWTNYGTNVYWSSSNFTTVTSDEKWDGEYDQKDVLWDYDQLAFTIYDLINFANRRNILRKGVDKDGYFYFSDREVTGKKEESERYMMAPKSEELSYSLTGRVSGVQIYGSTSPDSTVLNGFLKRDDNQTIQPRKNFNETAFFFPDLKTDSDGAIEFSFTTPEALTKWKLQTLVHTKELAFGYDQKEMITQKQLMVQPNMPRFLRQGDHIEMVTKVVNLSDTEMTGQVQLELFDATTNQSVDGYFINTFPNQYFTVAAGQSEVVKFPIQVPMQFTNALTWRITARAGNFSDGEEDALPVLSNKILVTETMPLPMKGTGTKNFTFEKLLQSGNSETLQHQSITVEYTSNPAWYAVQALPYLMEFPYECAEQTWNRYYANSLASKIVNASPRIKQIFSKWLDSSKVSPNGGGLEGALQKNQELKSALLEETPWVLEAKSEEQQKKNIALLFDAVKMSNELGKNLSKLKELLNENGSFPWFKGGYDDRYITQYILTGIGHLTKLNAISKAQQNDLNEIVVDGLNYLDKRIKEDYDRLIKSKANLAKEQISSLQIQYLYMRSFFSNAIAPASQTAFNYYKKQASQYWKNQSKYLQGMIALTLSRANDKSTPTAILKSLKETSISNEELGMYWKDNRFGYSWYWSYAPIETQSLMIEAFSEILKDTKTVDELRTWLIKNKQTNNWSTTKATADACYAMLLQGTDWLINETVVQIKLGTTIISNTNSATEAGTGYFKQTISGEKVEPGMGTITVSVQQPINKLTNQPINSSWGSVYWQYFEDMDKITSASTPLQLTKKLFIEKNTDRGPVLTPVEEGTELHVGDRIKVRIELRVDRDMEYVHMKDMRASAFEPVNVLSGYKWQGGLGYYESTKDASTNFFFDHLQKGSYVFEYPLFVTHTGTFSNGITTIQCMYAPEFSAHSEGVKITVE